MAETYTSGAWVVKPGEEDVFVQEWTAFVRWASEMPARGRFASFATSMSPNVT
jgi:hypothetical protein